jgi:hypothetical protein
MKIFSGKKKIETKAYQQGPGSLKEYVLSGEALAFPCRIASQIIVCLLMIPKLKSPSPAKLVNQQF